MGVKVRSFGTKKDENARNVGNDEIHKRIKSILRRVLILALFFQISAGCTVFFYGILRLKGIVKVAGNLIVSSVFSSIMSISVFLMQDHNTGEYVGFLRIL